MILCSIRLRCRRLCLAIALRRGRIRSTAIASADTWNRKDVGGVCVCVSVEVSPGTDDEPLSSGGVPDPTSCANAIRGEKENESVRTIAKSFFRKRIRPRPPRIVPPHTIFKMTSMPRVYARKKLSTLKSAVVFREKSSRKFDRQRIHSEKLFISAIRDARFHESNVWVLG